MRVLISLLAILLPLSVSAQPPEGQDWWACQSVESAGLIWKDQRWESTLFAHDERFILIGEGGGLSLESVAKAMEAPYSDAVKCFDDKTGNMPVFCVDKFGTSLGFYPETETGVITQILGGVIGPLFEQRDNMYVTPFECTKG